MQLLTLAALLSVARLALAGSFDSKNVKALSASNFKAQVLENEKATMMAFYAPWCGHCKALAPEYEKAGANLKNLVNFAAVDCDAQANKRLCSEYGIQGFPTIKYFPGKKRKSPKDYMGERKAKALADYAVDWMPSHVKILKEPKEVSALLETKSSKPLSLLLTSASKITPLYKGLSSDFNDSIEFYAMKDSAQLAEVKSQMGIEKVPSLVMIDESGKKQLYEGKLNYDGLHSFYSKNGRGKDEL